MCNINMLTKETISELADRDDVRSIAVWNFLSTLGGQSVEEALCNLALDAKLYLWNGATQGAIREGIAKYYTEIIE